MSVEYPNLNYALAQKKRFDTKPKVYKVKQVINLYKNVANHHLKNFNTPNFNVKKYKTLAQSLYNQGKYKQYVKYTHELLRQLKATKAGLVGQSPGNIPETPPASAPPPPGSPNVKLITEHPQYVGSATMKRKENLVDMFNRINIVGGIKKIFLRNPGNKFAVLARKDKNEANKNIEKYREWSLRLDVFVVLDDKKATVQFFSTGMVIITGPGDEKSLKNVASKFNNIENVKLVLDKGTFRNSDWAINFWNEQKVTEFLKLCYSKKYHAIYEPGLANPIIIGIQKMGVSKGKTRYKHTLLFQKKGGIQFFTSDLSECKKLLTQLLKDALKKGLLYRLGLQLGKNQKPKREKKKTTCANPPNPPDSFEGDCQPGYYCRPNAQGFPCCYMIPKDLDAGRKAAIAAYKTAGVKMPEKVKKVFYLPYNIVPTNANKQKNVVFNMAKGLLIRKLSWKRYSKEDLAKFAKTLGIDWARAVKEREGQRKKLPPGGWKQWLHDQMVKKLAANTLVEQHVSGSGSNSSHVSYHVASENKPILLQMNNRTHRLTIKPGPPIMISGFIRRNKRRKQNEITSRVCSTLDRDVLERIARRVGIKNEKKMSKPQLCQAVYEARKQIKENYVSPTKPPKAKPKPNKAAPFRLVEAKPDGNCFYEAFLRGLTGGNIAPTAEQIQKLRNKVKAYYTVKYANRTNNNIVDVDRNGKSMTKTQFMNYVTTNKAWAGQAEIVAVANKMSTNIIVLTPRYRVHKQFTVRDPEFQFTVYLRYNAEMHRRGTHFDTLIPVANGKVNFASASSSSSAASSSPLLASSSPLLASSSPLLASSSPLLASSSSGRKSSSGSSLANFAAEVEANLGGLPQYH